jgi:hypothetical protein
VSHGYPQANICFEDVSKEVPIFGSDDFIIEVNLLVPQPNKEEVPNNGCTSLSKQGVCHIVALPFTLKSILSQNKNYGNSNISPSKNIIFKEIL